MDFNNNNDSNSGGVQGDQMLPVNGPSQLNQISEPNPLAVDKVVQNNGVDFDMQIKSLPAEANDVDLIEKEWVIHLKHIVNQTVGNPYRQQLEVSLAKADYLKKRYGKEIKASAG